MYFVLIETSGNQRYIFATNKLRENIGASELTHRLGTQFTLDAVKAVTKLDLYSETPQELRRRIGDLKCNPPLDIKSEGPRAEVLVATSGKSLLLVDSQPTGQAIIRHVTTRALREAPGVTVHGAMTEATLTSVAAVHRNIKQVHDQLQEVRHLVPGIEQRFLRLPFTEECATSGLPAASYEDSRAEPGARSAVTLAKRRHQDHGRQRMRQAIHDIDHQMPLSGNLADLEKRFEQLDWLAVIHADGNGLGQIFLQFDKHVSKAYPNADWRDYLNAYRHFSLALDTCTVLAFTTALQGFQRRFDAVEQQAGRTHLDQLPIVPLVLGGDDLSVLCDGRFAVRLTYEFLKAFEHETGRDHQDGVIKKIAQSAFGVPRLGICAGIAIVKPHFPFHAAYDLAESLLQSAKQVKQRVCHSHDGANTSLPCSAIDYHLLYDASGADFDRIRGQLAVDHGETKLVGRPYVVTEEADLSHCQDRVWLQPRLWPALETRVQAMLAPEADDSQRRALPNSMLHDLREGLFLGHAQADARMRLVRKRYERQGFDQLLGDRDDPGSLFWQQPAANGEDQKRATGLLDALDIVEFWNYSGLQVN